MAIHPSLQHLPKTKYLRVLSKLLTVIDKDLSSLGPIDYELEYTVFEDPKSFLYRLFVGHSLKDPAEALTIRTNIQNCPVEIVLGIAKRSIKLPYFIFVEIPQPFDGQAEFRYSSFGNKWQLTPKNRRRKSEIKRTIPKVKMIHSPGGIAYIIQIGHSLEATENGKTLWTIHSSYEGGGFSRKRPRPSRFLKAIPSVEAMLKKWNEDF